MDVAIIGRGVVGSSMARLFPDAIIHDPGLGFDAGIVRTDVAFVCVPTPEGPDGSADLSAIEQVFDQHQPGIFVIRSTVPPGTSRRLGAVFQPEYLGVTIGHTYGSDRDVPFVILGGPEGWTARVADLYRSALPPETAIHRTDSLTAELVKYATNTFLAAKVEFANEIADLAEGLGLDYDEIRELWLLDRRIGRSHTAINRLDRGFGGPCFPKDIAALVSWAEERGQPVPMIRAAMEANRERRSDGLPGSDG